MSVTADMLSAVIGYRDFSNPGKEVFLFFASGDTDTHNRRMKHSPERGLFALNINGNKYWRVTLFLRVTLQYL